MHVLHVQHDHTPANGITITHSRHDHHGQHDHVQLDGVVTISRTAASAIAVI